MLNLANDLEIVENQSIYALSCINFFKKFIYPKKSKFSKQKDEKFTAISRDVSELTDPKK